MGCGSSSSPAPADHRHRDAVSQVIPLSEPKHEHQHHQAAPPPADATPAHAAVANNQIQPGAKAPSMIPRRKKKKQASPSEDGSCQPRKVLDTDKSDSFDPRDFNKIFSHVTHNKYQYVKRMLQVGCPVNITNDHGFTPLHMAVINSNEMLTHILLEANANVNHQNDKGDTALHSAYRYNVPKRILDMLLEAGADLQIANHDGLVPGQKGVKTERPFCEILKEVRQH
eukprot:TRINITY_DN1798_c0_g1_i3.p1 TRINITY_DN1798_c0_g1~~TRINITY_DN1798_c0_g1_i3.p1  ORF type:complete len:241 (+),score=56.23 TRINITY_DN1798_c0_g1_i3:45-725(+)